MFVEEAATGVGGLAGIKNAGMAATEEIMATYSVMGATSDGTVARKGLINWPRAPPNGFARLASAVADTRPRVVNQRSEYAVGEARTKGCAKPIRICPTITPAYEGGEALVDP